MSLDESFKPLLKQIESSNSHITAVCQRLLDNLPEPSVSENYRLYLHNFVIYEYRFRKFIENAVKCCANNVKVGYSTFINAFPKIKLAFFSKPDSKDMFVPYYTDNLKGVIWQKDYAKLAIVYFHTRCFSEFLCCLFKDPSNNVTESEIQELLSSSINFVLEYPHLTKNEKIAIIESMYALSYPIYLASKRYPNMIWNLFNTLYKESEDNNVKASIVCTAFSSIKIPDCVKEIDAIIELICGKYDSFAVGSIEFKYINIFLCNLVMRTFQSSKPFSDNILNLIKVKLLGVLENNQPVSVIKFASILSNYCNVDSRFNELHDFLEYFSTLSDSSYGSYINALVSKISGKNYASEVEISIEHNNFSMRSKDSEHDFELVYNFLVSNCEKLGKEEESITLLFEQLIILSIKGYMDKLIQYVADNNNAFNTFGIPLIKSLRRFNHYEDLYRIQNPTIPDSTYIELKSKAYDICKTNLVSQTGTEKICTRSYQTNSFTSSMIATLEDREAVLLNNIYYIYEMTSKNHTQQTQTPKDISSFLSSWEFMISYNNFASIYDQDPEKKEESEENLAKLIADSFKIIYIMEYLALYKPSEEICSMISVAVFSPVPLVGALALRILQAIVHEDPNFTNKIIECLCGFFLHRNSTFASISRVIEALVYILEASNFEGFRLSKEANYSISIISLIGYCVPSYSIHKKIIELSVMLNSLSSSDFDLQRFLVMYENDLSSHAMGRAIGAISSAKMIDLKTIDILLFKDVAQSNHSTLYIYYLTSLGHYLSKKSKEISEEFVEVICHIEEKLLNILSFVGDGDDIDPIFRYNALAFIISVSDLLKKRLNPDLLDSQFRKIQTIVKVVLNKSSKDNSIKNIILFMGIFSMMSPSLAKYIFPMFTNGTLMLQCTAMFTFKQFCKNKVLQVYDDNEKIEKYILSVLLASLIFCYKENVISEQLKFAANTKVIDDSPMYNIFLDNFFISLKYVLKQVYLKHSQKTEVFIIQPTTIYLPREENPFDGDSWFIFFCNLSEMRNSNFFNSLMKAFATWARISPIPDDHFAKLMENLPVISKTCHKLAGAIFDRYSQQSSEGFVNFFLKYGYKFNMFLGIVSRLDIHTKIQAMIEKAPQKLMILPYSSLVWYYQNIGSLLALCLYHMTSKKAAHRRLSMKYLTRLLLLTFLIRNDKKSFAKIFIKMKEIKTIMLASLPVFIQKDLVQLNQMISMHLKFCGEQFAQQCFNVVFSVDLQRKTNQEAIQRKLTEVPVIKRRNSQRQTSLGLNIPTNFLLVDTDKTQSNEHVVINRCDVVTSLVANWLEPLSINLHKNGVSSECDSHYQCFCFYNLLDNLLKLGSIQGMTQSIATIIDVIISSVPRLFILCLFSLQALSEDYTNIATLFLIYMYNKNTSTFIEEINEYLRISAWFFYEIQLSKIDQQFNMGKFLDALTDKEIQQEESMDNDEESDVDYIKTLRFALNLLKQCLKENSDGLQPIKTNILIFCILQNENFEGISDDLISKITGLKQMNVNKGAFVTKKVETFSLTDLLPFIPENSVKTLLEWGLCCGDLEASTKALKIFEMKGFVLPEEALPAMLNSMQVATNVLEERTDPSKKSQFNQWLMRVIGDGPKPKYKETVQYILLCMNIIQHFIETGHNISVDMLWAIANFLQCSSLEYDSLFTAALNIIALYVESPALLKQLKTKPEGKLQDGLLPLLLNLQTKDIKSLEAVLLIVKKLMINGLISLLGPSPSTEAVAAFTLIPSLYGSINKKDKKVYKFLKIENAKHLIKSIMSKDLNKVVKLADIYYESIKDDEIAIHQILNFYSQLSKVGVKREVVFIVSHQLFKKVPHINSKYPEISIIAYYASTNQESESSPEIIEFLRDLNKKHTFVSMPTTNASHGWTHFPSIKITRTSYQNWSPESKDVFSSYKFFPPLYLTDFGFVGSKFLKFVKRGLDKVHVVPFHVWYEMLFQLQIQSTSELNTAESISVRSTTLNPMSFLQDVFMMIKNPETIETSEIILTTPNNNQMVSTFEMDFAEEDTQYAFDSFKEVDTNDFFPVSNFINAIGKETLSDFNLPNIFGLETVI